MIRVLECVRSCPSSLPAEGPEGESEAGPAVDPPVSGTE